MYSIPENATVGALLFSSPHPFYHSSSNNSNNNKMRPTVLPLLGLILLFSAVVTTADLQVGFYNSTCPQAESIVREVVREDIRVLSQAAWFIRLYFHDCFHTGCDASILIQTTADNHQVETDVHVNKNLFALTFIDDVKSAIEKQCPRTVSCADILALATRDAVAIASGGAINYTVPTGRRDGLSSTAEGVELPEPNITVADAVKVFNDKNFTTEEMVVLLGAHSTGVASCDFFRDRMFNYKGKNGTSDPHMDAALKSNLSSLCGPVSEEVIEHSDGGTIILHPEPTANLDQGTAFTLDNLYYGQLLAKKGLLQVDQELAFDDSTASIVASYLSNATLFNQKFAEAMVKLGNLGVLVGDEGEIRTACDRFNS